MGHEIDGDVLLKLTVENLKDLGAVVVGHWRKIMSAIEALNAPSGSTALSARLDSEDMRQVIRAYQGGVVISALGQRGPRSSRLFLPLGVPGIKKFPYGFERLRVRS